MPLLQALGLPAAAEVEKFRARMILEKELELQKVRDAGAKQDPLERQATRDMLAKHLSDTGRSRDVSADPDVAKRIDEDAGLEAARLAKRKDLLSVVFSKTEIGINQQRLADEYAKNSPDRATVRGEAATAAAAQNRLDAKKSDVVNLKLVPDVLNTVAVDVKAQALLDEEIEQRTNDRLSERYADLLAAGIEQNLIASGKPDPTEEEKIAAAQEVMKAEEGDVGGLGIACGAIPFAHFDSRHTRPTTEQQLGRLGSGCSPDLQSDHTQTGTKDRQS